MDEVTQEVPLDPLFNRTGNVWCIFVEGELHNMMYGYRFDGMFGPYCRQYFNVSNVMVNPCAKFARRLLVRQMMMTLSGSGQCNRQIGVRFQRKSACRPLTFQMFRG